MRAQFLDVVVSASMTARIVRASADAERKPEMLLKNKVAVIYGAGGAIGGAVSRAFVATTGRVKFRVWMGDEAHGKRCVSSAPIRTTGSWRERESTITC